MIASAVESDYAPLQSALDPRIDFDAYKKEITPYIPSLKQEMGGFKSAGQIWQRAYEFEGDGEAAIFVSLKFQKGYAVLRVIRNVQGRIIQISPRNPVPPFP